MTLDDQDATAVIKKADESYVRVPLYYIYQEKGTELRHEIREDGDTSNSGFKYTWLSERLGEEVNHANLVALEIPHGTKTTSGLSNYTALEEVIFPLTATGFPKCENNQTLKRVFAKQEQAQDGTIIGITTVPDYHFKNIPTLEVFKMELDYLTYIGSNAFYNAAITEFTAEGPFTGMGGGAFNSCKSLTTVYLNNTSGTTVSCGGQSFMSAINLTSVTLNGFSLPDYLFEKVNGLTGGLTVIATGVTSTGTMPFKNATNLESVEISGPITSIGSSLFLGCTNLKEIKITNTLDTPASGGNNMCDGLKNLESVTLHGVSLGSRAFMNTDGAEGMVIKATNVGSIGDQAFFNAENVTEIYVEGPFTSVSSGHSFRDNGKLTTLTVINTGNTEVTMGNGEINPELVNLTIKGKFTLGSIENSGSPLFQNNAKLKNVFLGNGVRVVGNNVFYKCYSLEEVYLADTICVIGDRVFDMEAAGNQKSASFMFVDENGNMDNTLPTSLTTIGGHFLKHTTIANTEFIFPESFTCHNSSQAYDFEGTIYPEGFRLIYLGKMTELNLLTLKNRDVTVYLTKNSASDIANHKVYAYVDGTTLTDNGGVYAGINENGTLTIALDNSIKNGIYATECIKLYFCGSNEVCFLTRRNIAKGEETSVSWDNFVTTPVTYEQLETAYAVYNEASEVDKTVPLKHPIVSEPVFSGATCEEPGGTKTYCLGCGKIASIEKTEDALGHNYDYVNNENAKLIAIVYSDYTANGTKTVACANCGVENDEIVAEPLFENKGYSTPESFTGNIVIGFVVNEAAVNEYESTGKAVKYGVFVALKSTLVSENGEAIDAVDANGNMVNGVIGADLTSHGVQAFEIKITGFTTEEQQNAQIIMGAYAINENKEIFYMQDSKNSIKAEKYYYTSYSAMFQTAEEN